MNRTARLFTARRLVPLFAVFVNGVWGAGYALTKVLYDWLEIESFEIGEQIWLMGLRAFLTGTLVLVLKGIKDRRFPAIKKTSYKSLAALVFAQVILQYLFMYIGLAHASGVHASIIDPTSVFSSVLVACLIFKTEKLTAKKLIGTLVGFLGVVLVNLDGLAGPQGFSFLGEGFLIIGMAVYGFAEPLIKITSGEESPVSMYGWSFALGGLFLWGLGAGLGGAVTAFSVRAVLLLLLSLILTTSTFILWGLLLKYNPVSSVTVYGFTIPFFGVILSVLALNEGGAINRMTVPALILVTIGIIIVNRAQTED